MVDWSLAAGSLTASPALEHPELLAGPVQKGLQALDEHPAIAGREGMRRIHDWVKETIKAEPATIISQKAISVNVGSYRPNIKEYLALAVEALAAPAVARTAVVAEVPAAVAKSKPHLVSEKVDGEWVAIASINGVEVARARSVDRVAAMREAFTLASES